MKISNHLVVFPLCTTLVSASSPDVKRQITLPFNAELQRVSTTGKHKFVPPGPEDQRGPCPGLNALANHGYLPHNGVGTIADFITATTEVFGLGPDFASLITVYGAIMQGDGKSWSIGGPSAHGFSHPAPGLIGRPQGISFSHNNYEGDASVARPDLYLAGNDYKLDMEAFQELDNALPANSFQTLIDHRDRRVRNSVQTNPYFFNGPFTGLVTAAANAFVWRLAANHSAEYPEGYMSKSTFRTFWSVRERHDGSLYWKPGWDRIPDNWYRRNVLESYNFVLLNRDLGTYFQQHPYTAKFGGNLGKVNTFTGIDLANATGGVYNAKDLGKGNNAGCLAFQAAALAAPDMLSKIWKDISGPMAQLTAVLEPIIAKAGCKKLKKFDEQALMRYPGYSEKYRYYKGA